jgi:hypothetical protein
MKKNRIVSGLLAAVIVLNSALLIPTFDQTNNGIRLKVIDGLQHPNKVIMSLDDGKELIVARRFLAKGYRPIRLQFSNNSSKPVVITEQSIMLPTIAGDQAAQALHEGGIGRAITQSRWMFVDPFIMIPTGIVGTIVGIPLAICFNNMGAGQVGVTLASLIAIPTVVIYHWAQNRKRNHAITDLISSKSLKNIMILGPNQSIEFIVFIHKDMMLPKFNVQLKDAPYGATVSSFEVTL